MLSLKVNEIFYSLQGEGARAGEPSIFIRLQGCDLTCGFCDTEFESGEKILLDTIENEIIKFNCKWIVWTGGEPALQLTEQVIAWFKERNYEQAIETNGNSKVPKNIDYVCVSPKVAEHVLKRNFEKPVDELRYVRHSGQKSVPKPAIKAKYYFLSPMFNGGQIDIKNVKHCVDLCKRNPQWRLSLQIHKLLQIL